MTREVATVAVEMSDGETHQLRYERRHIFRLEKATGRTIPEFFDALTRGSYSAMVELTWAGLLHESPDITPEDVAELVALQDMGEIMEQVSTALMSVLGKDLVEGEVNPTPAPSSNDDASGHDS